MAIKTKEALKRKYKRDVIYNKEHTKRYVLAFTKGLDDEIINHLENKEKYSVYIKDLIKKDMEK